VQIKLYGLIKHRLTLFFYIKKSSSGPEANAVVEEEKEKVPSSSELCKLSCLSSNLTWAYLIFFSSKKRSSGPDEANEVVEEQEVYHTEEQVWFMFGAIQNKLFTLFKLNTY